MFHVQRKKAIRSDWRLFLSGEGTTIKIITKANLMDVFRLICLDRIRHLTRIRKILDRELLSKVALSWESYLWNRGWRP